MVINRNGPGSISWSIVGKAEVMIRPNIRGIPRESLSPTLLGWRIRGQPDVLLRYRMPLRKNWLWSLHEDSLASVLMSRSGRLHVMTKRPARSTNSRALAILLTASFGLAAAWNAFSAIPDGGKSLGNHAAADLQDVSPLPTASSSTQDSCSVLAKANLAQGSKASSGLQQAIEDWSNGASVSELAIELVREDELGGVKASVLAVRCQDLEKTFRAIWVRANADWQLKKLVQLEN